MVTSVFCHLCFSWAVISALMSVLRCCMRVIVSCVGGSVRRCLRVCIMCFMWGVNVRL